MTWIPADDDVFSVYHRRMSENADVTTTVPYQDDDLVYVDPEKRIVVGRVEFQQNGKPKALPMKTEEDVDDDGDDEKTVKGRKRPRRQRYYPWGTYRSMKRIYKLEGKQPRVESQKTLDEVLEKALKEPFWD